MCGIVGFQSGTACDVDLRRMVESVKHRGPDDIGVFYGRGRRSGIGQARLSIIDLSPAGHQPMQDSTGRFTVAYNGEIYNYRELRAELSTRDGFHGWVSSSDTEVLLEGYRLHRLDFLDRLNGIFAFAIHDAQDDSILLVRDPMGIKPLCVTEQAGGVYFASETKALWRMPGLTTTLRRQSVVELLSFMYVPEPETMFEKVTKLAPGEYRIYREGALARSGRLNPDLWRVDEHEWAPREAVERLRELLSESVRRQLVADVPVSLFLSGGLDSSAILAMVRAHEGRVDTAYTISIDKDDARFDGAGDDLTYARRVAERFGVRLHAIPAERLMLEELPGVVYHLDDCLVDPAAINTLIISRAARANGVKVMLSGQGADEVLGGYRRYRAEQFYRKVPSWVRKGMSAASALVPPRMPGGLNAAARRVKKLLGDAGVEADERILATARWTDDQVVLSLVHGDLLQKPGARHRALLREVSGSPPLHRMMMLDEKVYLPSHNLHYTDRMGMMVGVEARVPFLDVDLVRFAHSLPGHLLVRGGVQKWVLKEAMAGILPDEVIHRSKAGFGAPLRAWMRTGNEMMNRYLDRGRLARQGLFDLDVFDRLRAEHDRGAADHSYLMYALLNVEIWWDIFVDRAGGSFGAGT